MMRNYYKVILSTLMLGVVMTTGIFAASQEESHWTSSRPGSVGPKAEINRTLTPQQKALRKMGVIRHHGSPIGQTRAGLYPTPVISQRPANILRSPENPRGHLYGVVNRYNDMEYNYQAFVASFDMNSGKMNPLHYGAVFCPFVGDQYTLQTNTYRKGSIICPGSAQQLGEGMQIYIDEVDLQTGETIARHTLNTDCDTYSITYSPDEDVFYALAFDYISEKFNYLLRIDPNNDWQVLNLGNLQEQGTAWLNAIVYNISDKTLYIFDTYGLVYSVEQNGGDFRVIEAGAFDQTGALWSEGDCGQICYSPSDEMYLAVYRDNSIKANRLLYINPDTFEIIEGAVLAQQERPYITSIFVTDDFAEPDAPEIVADPVISFTDNNLSGNISFVAPEYTYVGVALGSTPVKVVATVDGKEVYNQTVSAKQAISLPLTLEEGYHELVIVSYNGEFASPKRTVNFYTGFDAPKTPENVALDIDKLTWTKPGNVGKHQGYVDVNDITYNVYLNGVKQNAEPITAEEFVITRPAVQDLCEISVEAVSHGHASDAASLNEVVGKAYELPFFQMPNQVESKAYRTVNNNRDNRVWFWTDESATAGSDMYGWAMSVGYETAADDWLIFPAINFPSADIPYSLEFDLAGMMVGMITTEGYEIYLGKQPTIQSMLNGINVVKEPYYLTDDTFQHHTYTFAVPEAGEYYIALRINSTKDTEPSGMGLLVNDFKVAALDGKSAAIPGEPTDVVIAPNLDGEQYFVFTANIPTLDITGKPLPADDEVTITVTAGDVTRTVSGKPGEKVSVEVGVTNDGFANIHVTPSNANGNGYTRAYRSYVGIDVPLCPTNIHATMSADNMTMHYTWTAPGTVGWNNGPVKPEEVYYKFYTRAGISLAYIDQTYDTKYDFTPYGTEAASQAATLAGVSANNVAGESRNSIFYQDEVGKPYELPIVEEFGTTRFDYGPYRQYTEGDCAMSSIENVGNMNGVGIGDPIFVQGGIVAYCVGYTTDSRFVLPKVTTSGIAKTMFGLRYWDYAEAPESVQIYARRYGNEEEKFVGEFKFNRPAKGEWVDAAIALPEEYNNCPWIQIRVGAYLRGGEDHMNEYLLFDNYSIYPDIDYDLKVFNMTGKTQVTPGETAIYQVTVVNGGLERTNGNLEVTVETEDGEVLAESKAVIPMLNASQVFEFEAPFELTGKFANYKNLNVIAKVTSDIDDNLNNNSKVINVNVMNSSLPVVSDLKAEKSEAGATLTWSTPEGQYGDFENFENLTPFEVTEQIGSFTNIDLDGLYPAPLENGSVKLEWEGCYQPQGWTVVNLEDLNMMNDSRIYPYSGKQVLMARSGWFEQDKPVQSSKWLISPEVAPGSEVSFFASTLSSGDYEYIEIWGSETTPQLDPERATLTRNGSFRRLKAWSKVGSETWEPFNWKLENRYKYFALRYCSYDGLALVLDDLTFTPANLINHDITHYSVYRSVNGAEPELIATDLKSTSYVDDKWDNNYTTDYYVLAHANYANTVKAGPKSNIATIIGINSVGEINGDSFIAGGKGEVRIDGFQGEEVVIANADGKVVVKATVNAPQAHYALPAGIYVVTCGKSTAKVVVR